MRGCVRVLAFVLLVSFLPPVSAGAQEAAMVPEEFALAVVGGNADLLIGTLPVDLAGLLRIPDDARVIGSVVFEQFSRAFISIAGDPDRAVGFVGEQMIAAGWRTPAERQPSRGFQRPQQEVASATFCGPDDEYLTVSAGETDIGTLARLQFYTEFPRALPCDRPTPEQRQRRRDELEERMPILILPAEEFGMVGRGGTFADNGTQSRWTTGSVSTERTPGQVADDIAEQLADEGWTLEFESDGENDAVRTWSRRFDDGVEARGSLVLTEVRPGTFDALFRLIKLPER